MSQAVRRAVFPGTFDPFTLGHENIARKALRLFDELYIAVGVNTTKPHFLIPPEVRRQGIAAVFAGEPRVHAITFTGLTVDLCRKVGARFIVRGVRNAIDWAHEWEIAQANRRLAPDIETILFIPDEKVAHIRSTIVREVAFNEGSLDSFVPRAFLVEWRARSKE